MATHLILTFIATVLPLVCTPGPDMLFIASQAVAGTWRRGVAATFGVCSGYLVHSLLVALGLAAIIAASPWLFACLRWAGVAYLVYLAAKLLRSAMTPARLQLRTDRGGRPFGRGFATAALNPKGMMIYFAILPQFIDHHASVAAQAVVLSALFIALCAIVYIGLSIALAWMGRTGTIHDRRRRWVEGVSGGLLAVAAVRLASR